MTGHILVDNTTGHAIRVPGCLTLFQVDLASPRYRPTVAWADCLQEITIPAGHTRERVTIQASYNQCGRGHQRDGMQECLPGGHMPPLPPGTYHARLFQSRRLVQIPPAVTVQVTPSSHH